MRSSPVRLFAEIMDRLVYAGTLTALNVLDWLAGPIPETRPLRAIRQAGERLRDASRESILTIRSVTCDEAGNDD